MKMNAMNAAGSINESPSPIKRKLGPLQNARNEESFNSVGRNSKTVRGSNNNNQLYQYMSPDVAQVKRLNQQL